MSALFLTRRHILGSVGAATAALGLARANAAAVPKEDEEEEVEVGAVEDLLREHGVLRRALIVYSEVAALLRSGSAFDTSALNRAAKLFQSFGEDYHERKLEEAYIFPAVKKAGGPAASLPDILLAQHNRGREITAYILQASQKAKPTNIDAGTLAPTLDGFVRMYRSHAAREDTVVFPAWKATLSPEQLEDLGEEFEDIEHKQFGSDGFDDAVKEISAIEQALGLSDLAQFTAPPLHA